MRLEHSSIPFSPAGMRLEHSSIALGPGGVTRKADLTPTWVVTRSARFLVAGGPRRAADLPRDNQMTSPDFEAIKKTQRAGWETGDHPRVGNTLQIIAELLVEATDVRAGQRVLDVA
jgi:hypothetical protein